ncbi:hypothetical protein ACFL43_07640, partial [Thermodesulfobacteriota bacterium]
AMHARVKKILTATAAAALLLAPIAFSAGALRLPLSTHQLTLDADVVIRGRVLAAAAQWNDDRTLIFTRAAVEVQRSIRGSSPQAVIWVEYPGGEVDGVGLGVSDGPRLAAGEAVLLFLKAHSSFGSGAPGQTFRICGSAQGKYTITGAGMAIKQGFSLPPEGREVDIDAAISIDALERKIRAVNENTQPSP